MASAVVVVAAVGHRAVTMPSGNGWVDAFAYLDGAGALFHQPSALYSAAQQQLSVQAAERAYIYPPAGLLPFLPLVPIADHAGIRTAAAIWLMIDTAALITATVIIGRRLHLEAALTAGMVLLIVISAPLLSEIGAVQVNGVVLLCIALAWRDLASRRMVRAGMWMGLAVAIKPVVPLLLLLPLLRRQWRTAAAAVAIAVGLNVLLVPVIGLDAAGVYVTRVLPFLASHVTESVDNLSPQSILDVAIGGQPYYPAHHAPLSPLHLLGVATVLALALRATAVILWAVAVRRTDDDGLGLALTAALVPVVTATVWAHYYLYLVPLFLWAVARTRGTRRALLVGAVALFAVNGRLGGFWMPDIEVSHSLGNLFFFIHGLAFAILVPIAVIGALLTVPPFTSSRAAAVS
jgi:arabinofuranan 3-O-arabinosyltransferase